MFSEFPGSGVHTVVVRPNFNTPVSLHVVHSDIFQYPDFRHIVFNTHLLVFVGHLVVAVHPVAVGCGLA